MAKRSALSVLAMRMLAFCIDEVWIGFNLQNRYSLATRYCYNGLLIRVQWGADSNRSYSEWGKDYGSPQSHLRTGTVLRALHRQWRRQRWFDWAWWYWCWRRSWKLPLSLFGAARFACDYYHIPDWHQCNGTALEVCWQHPAIIDSDGVAGTYSKW